MTKLYIRDWKSRFKCVACEEEPEKFGGCVKIQLVEENSFAMNFTLCPRCAKKYAKILAEQATVASVRSREMSTTIEEGIYAVLYGEDK